MNKNPPYNLIIDTSTYLRLLMATPENRGYYTPGFLSIIEEMTEMRLIRPIYSGEVISEALNSASIPRASDLFNLEEIDGKPQAISCKKEGFDITRFPKTGTRFEHFRRMYNLGAKFVVTDVRDLYLNAIKHDEVLGEMDLKCGMKVKQTTPELLNEQLKDFEGNKAVIAELKKRRIRSDIGEIACGAIALKCQERGIPASILFQGNDVRARVIYRANSYDPFIDATPTHRYSKDGMEKNIPHRFNPHRRGFDPSTTAPIADIGCLTTLGFLFPIIMSIKKHDLDTYLISEGEANDSFWYQDACPEGSLRGCFSTFLMKSAARVNGNGARNFKEYDALKDLRFRDVGVEVKHEHNHVNPEIDSPWSNFINSLDRETFATIVMSVREKLDMENKNLRSGGRILDRPAFSHAI